MKLRFTASNINSIAISRMMMFLRLMNIPATLMQNSSAPRMRKLDSETIASPYHVNPCIRFLRKGIPYPRLFLHGRFLFRGHLHHAHAVVALDQHLLRRILIFGLRPAAHGERDGGDDGHQQDRRGDLERIDVHRIQAAAELLGVAVVGGVLYTVYVYP